MESLPYISKIPCSKLQGASTYHKMADLVKIDLALQRNDRLSAEYQVSGVGCQERKQLTPEH
jgi:hypothetical protein